MRHGDYDYCFVTHLPSFYKVNLYNEIAKQCRVFVIFIADASQLRSPDFTLNRYDFDYTIINHTAFEERPLSSLIRTYEALKSIKYNKLVVGGWDLLEFWILVWMSSKKRNCLALESTIFESQATGLRKIIKKIFLSRISLVFASGTPHLALLKDLGYQGEIRKTQGVGIFHYLPKKVRNFSFRGKFLYVGRLAPEKNLVQLIQTFKQYPQYTLTIIGQGPMQDELQRTASPNVRIIGYVPNNELAKWYQQNDVFILPSTREPWGLVVEEALYYGLPVIVSNRVGCATDLVEKLRVGTLFDPLQPSTLKEAIAWVASHYEVLLENIKHTDFVKRDASQIQEYLEALA